MSGEKILRNEEISGKFLRGMKAAEAKLMPYQCYFEEILSFEIIHTEYNPITIRDKTFTYHT